MSASQALFRQAVSHTRITREEADLMVSRVHVREDTAELRAMQAYAEAAMGQAVADERYEELAVACMVTYIHSQVPGRFSVAMKRIHDGNRILDSAVWKFIEANSEVLDRAIRQTNDFRYPYRGVLTLMKSYLINSPTGTPMERINHLLMRVAVGNGYQTMTMDEILDVYVKLSEQLISVATPVMFNSGTLSGAPISCYLLPIKDDSIEGIYETLGEVAKLARSAGGIGLNVNMIRPKGDLIRSVNRESGGVPPMLKNYEATLAYVDQNKRRKGSAAIYLQPWHADIYDWLQLRTNEGAEETKCRSLFYGLWCPRLFFERVIEGGMWSLMSPVDCPNLNENCGHRFEALYTRYEAEGRFKHQVPARKLWQEIMKAECEIGMPYIHNGCLLNGTSNQQNLGTIQNSNLCAEIVEFSSPKETACCVLGSVVLWKIVRRYPAGHPEAGEPMMYRINSVTGDWSLDRDGNRVALTVVERLDLDMLADMVATLVRLLNSLISTATYVNKSTRRSNLRHRPLGIGVQGFAELLETLGLSFEDRETDLVNTAVFETMYYAAVTESIRQAKRDGPYDTWSGSPSRTGRLHFDLHGEYLQKYHSKYVGHKSVGIREEHLRVRHTMRRIRINNHLPFSAENSREIPMYDWDEVREDLQTHGMRNSLLLALMPTQSTSIILGNSESTYAKASNLFTHNMLAGSFVITNRNMVRDLRRVGLWTANIRDRIIAGEGSIQHITEIPENIRRIYKTAFEIDPMRMIDLSADRQWWIDQSQSFDHNVLDPKPAKLTRIYLYSYARGNGTVGYYTRSNPAIAGLKFAIDARLDLEMRGRGGKETPANETPSDPLDACGSGGCQG